MYKNDVKDFIYKSKININNLAYTNMYSNILLNLFKNRYYTLLFHSMIVI